MENAYVHDHGCYAWAQTEAGRERGALCVKRRTEVIWTVEEPEHESAKAHEQALRSKWCPLLLSCHVFVIALIVSLCGDRLRLHVLLNTGVEVERVKCNCNVALL